MGFILTPSVADHEVLERVGGVEGRNLEQDRPLCGLQYEVPDLHMGSRASLVTARGTNNRPNCTA
jgi:hypothetical protein